MDSLMVVQAVRLAGQLGARAQTVLIWWLVIRLAVPLVWAGVAVLAVFRLTSLAAQFGRGQALLKIVGRGSVLGISDSGYAKAQSVLLETFKPDGRD